MSIFRRRAHRQGFRRCALPVAVSQSGVRDQRAGPARIVPGRGDGHMTGRLSFVRDERGATAAEFAMLLPIALLFLLGLIDVGRYAWSVNQAEKATQIGARWAVATDMIPQGLYDYSFALDVWHSSGQSRTTHRVRRYGLHRRWQYNHVLASRRLVLYRRYSNRRQRRCIQPAGRSHAQDISTDRTGQCRR